MIGDTSFRNKRRRTHLNFSLELKKCKAPVKIKSLVKKWVEDFNNLGKVNAVNVSGTFNTLSKIRIFDKKWQEKEGQNNFKSLIVNLAKKGKAIYTEFNSQHIANTFNALSKWDIFNDSLWKGDLKDLIVNLAEKGKAIYKEFNSQAIANTFNALSQWDIFNDSLWKGDLKDLIVNLAKKGKAIYTEFNSQDIANTFNALSKWDIFHDSRWEGDQRIFKDLIVNLAKKGKAIYTEFNSQHIANTFNALSKWDIFNDLLWTKDEQKEFKFLITNLANQAITIIQTQHQQFDIRYVSSITCDLPKLKAPTGLLLRELLTSLMRRLGANEYHNKYSEKDWSKDTHYIIFSLDNFANIIESELVDEEGKRSLFSDDDFNKNLLRTLNKLLRFQLTTYKVLKTLKGVSKLTKIEEIKNREALKKPFYELLKKLPFTRLSEALDSVPDELLKSLHLEGYLDRFLEKVDLKEKDKLIKRIVVQLRQLKEVVEDDLKITEDDLKITEDNMIIDETTPIKYTLEEFKQKLKEEKEIEYKSGIEVENKDGPYYKHNVEKGKPKIWVAPVAAVEGEKNWGIFAENEIEIGTFLGTYAGERVRVVQSGTSENLYIFGNVQKSVSNRIFSSTQFSIY